MTAWTIGKFMPPHKGHDLLIKAGLKAERRIDVIVSGTENDAIPLSTRVEWMRKIYGKTEGVKIISHHDLSSHFKWNVDDEGTVLDDSFWEYWKDVVKTYCPDADVFVSSDAYGKKMAEVMDALWLPVDPHRMVFDVTATQIRNRLMARNLVSFSERDHDLFSMIMPEARPYFSRKVAIVGAESTGKTTLTEDLAYEFDAGYVPEYGRILSERRKNKLVAKDFVDIIQIHKAMVEEASKNHLTTFIDTESFTTALFSDIYLDSNWAKGEIEYEVKHGGIGPLDATILLHETVPFFDDGERVTDEMTRKWFTHSLKRMMVAYPERFGKILEIDDKNFAQRNIKAKKFIASFG